MSITYPFCRESRDSSQVWPRRANEKSGRSKKRPPHEGASILESSGLFVVVFVLTATFVMVMRWAMAHLADDVAQSRPNQK
jgi:hypothetical protein